MGYDSESIGEVYNGDQGWIDCLEQLERDLTNAGMTGRNRTSGDAYIDHVDNEEERNRLIGIKQAHDALLDDVRRSLAGSRGLLEAYNAKITTLTDDEIRVLQQFGEGILTKDEKSKAVSMGYQKYYSS